LNFILFIGVVLQLKLQQLELLADQVSLRALVTSDFSASEERPDL
jgi:hypothetical protein